MSANNVTKSNAASTTTTTKVAIDFERYESDRKACMGLKKVAESLNTVDAFLHKAGAPLTEEQIYVMRALNQLLTTARVEDMREFGRDGAKFIK